MCESIVKLNAICMICFSCDASFTKRRGDETQIELVGGKESYLAVCRDCFNAKSPVKSTTTTNNNHHTVSTNSCSSKENQLSDLTNQRVVGFRPNLKLSLF